MRKYVFDANNHVVQRAFNYGEKSCESVRMCFFFHEVDDGVHMCSLCKSWQPFFFEWEHSCLLLIGNIQWMNTIFAWENTNVDS